MESSKRNVVHIIAGGVGGTAGAVLTCPLEVVKTRLQSSSAGSFGHLYVSQAHLHLPWQTSVMQIHMCSTCHSNLAVSGRISTAAVIQRGTKGTANVFVCLRHILNTEGIKGLFKGIGPNLIGVFPSRAIYFGTYAKSKRTLNEVMTPNTHLVHLCSAVTAGVSAATCTNPIWLIKTRLQLDQKWVAFRHFLCTTGRTEGGLTCRECMHRIYKQNGILGFYKGLTASYYGVSETVLHLVVYEALKAHLMQKTNHERSSSSSSSDVEATDFLKFMLAGGISKSIATTLAYPHEVARTRLREEGTKYRAFFQTLSLVVQEEGFRGLYRGLTTQLIRQIPNTAVVMATYEAVVYGLSRLFEENSHL